MQFSDRQRDFLSQPNVGVLSTAGPSGEPQAAPVWYRFEEGHFLINTDAGCQKHRNIERDPRVAFVVDRREPPYYAVMMRGRAEIGPAMTHDALLAHISRYVGEEMARELIAGPAGSADRITIRVIPEKVMEFDPTASR